MAVDKVDHHIVWMVAAPMMAFVLTAVALSVRQRDSSLGSFAVIIFGTWLLACKAAFVRLDVGHEMSAPIWALSSLAIAWLLVWRRTEAVWVRGLAVGSLAVSVVAADAALQRAKAPGLAATIKGLPVRLVRGAETIVTAQESFRRDQIAFDESRARIEATHALPSMTGTVDVYPTDISAVLSHRLRYAPRPVPQSYSAYTPALARLNAKHLQDAGAAENILFDVAPIDWRLASMDDGLSWSAIWQYYNFVADTGGFLWLRRRLTANAPLDVRILRTTQARLGSEFDIPSVRCGGVMMGADLRPTFLYRLKSLFWKGPAVWIRLSADSSDRRLVPSMMSVGFLVSPVINSRQQFAQFMLPPAAGAVDTNRETRARIFLMTEQTDRYFAPEFTARFYAVTPPMACSVP